jgi:hypothetical protein
VFFALGTRLRAPRSWSALRALVALATGAWGAACPIVADDPLPQFGKPCVVAEGRCSL